MKQPVAKITKVDVSELPETSKGRRAELTCEATIEVAGQKYTRRFTVVADDHFIHHIGGPLTVEQLKQMVLTEVDKIQSLHSVAAQIEAKKDVDLVAEVVAKRVLE